MKEKIICEYCGTIYNSSEECCPLCQTKPEADNYMGDHYDFDERLVDDEDEYEEPVPRKRGGKIAALIVLLALFVGFTGYLLYSFELLPFLKPAQSAEVECTALSLDATELALTEAGMTAQLTVTRTPEDTTQTLSFRSSNQSVATVTQDGLVQAVASGTATITVVCGTQQAVCTVNCSFAEETRPEEPEPEAQEPEPEVQQPDVQEPLTISAEDISFFAVGENTVLTLTGADGADVIWQSTDASVASVDDNGYVEAVSSGTATIIATVGDQSVSCIVRCNF